MYILHYIDESSQECFVAEISRDDGSHSGDLEHQADNSPTIDIADSGFDESVLARQLPGQARAYGWVTFTPPRKRDSLSMADGEFAAVKGMSAAWEEDLSPGVPSHLPALACPQSAHNKQETPSTSLCNKDLQPPSPSLPPPKDCLEEAGIVADSGALRTQGESGSAESESAEESNELDSFSIEHETEWLHFTPPRDQRNRIDSDSGNVKRILVSKPGENQSEWEVFSAPYFEAAKEQELVATVKRNNRKQGNASVPQPSKSENATSRSTGNRLQAPSPPPSPELLSKQPVAGKASSISPTSVATSHKVRKLKVADLFPASRLDFEDLDSIGKKKVSVLSRLRLR
jgi:hypothetical protein